MAVLLARIAAATPALARDSPAPQPLSLLGAGRVQDAGGDPMGPDASTGCDSCRSPASPAPSWLPVGRHRRQRDPRPCRRHDQLRVGSNNDCSWESARGGSGDVLNPTRRGGPQDVTSPPAGVHQFHRGSPRQQQPGSARSGPDSPGPTTARPTLRPPVQPAHASAGTGRGRRSSSSATNVNVASVTRSLASSARARRHASTRICSDVRPTLVTFAYSVTSSPT